MCMIDGADPADLYHTRIVAHARKVHQCDECRRTIQVGERYRSTSMLYDYQWSDFATCEHCMSAEVWLKEQCGGYLHGGLLEDLEEHKWVFPLKRSPVTLMRLIVGMRRQWRSFTDPEQLMRPRVLA